MVLIMAMLTFIGCQADNMQFNHIVKKLNKRELMKLREWVNDRLEFLDTVEEVFSTTICYHLIIWYFIYYFVVCLWFAFVRYRSDVALTIEQGLL